MGSDFVCHYLPLADARGNIAGGHRSFCVVVRGRSLRPLDRDELVPLQEVRPAALSNDSRLLQLL